MTKSINSNFMRLLAATTAATMAFGAVAQTAPGSGIVHPIMAKTDAASDMRGLYTDGMIKAAKSVVAKDVAIQNNASSTAALYITMLESRLSNMPDKLTTFTAPEKYLENMFQLHGVVPSAQLMGGHATMCAAQDGKALGAWKIYLSPTSYYGADGKPTASFNAGQVVPRPVVPNTPDQTAKGRSACFNTLVAAAAEIKADHANAQQQAQAAQPTTTAAATPQTLDGLLASLANNGSIAKQAAPRAP